MRYQGERRDSKVFAVVDEDCGIPGSLVENYRAFNDNGPLAHSDPRSVLLSMSEYDKPQTYDVYEYPTATRPDQAQGYSAFSAHPPYTTDYVGAVHTQVPSGLPQSAAPFNPGPTAQSYAAPDPTYYTHQNVQYSTYVETAPRPLPEVVSFAPAQGQPGTKVTIYLRSMYDLDAPQVTPVIMFGQKRCSSILTKSAQPGQQFEYTLSVDAPPFTPAASPSPQVPLFLTFDQSSVTWDPPSLEFGSFSYLEQTNFYPVQTPEFTQKKRKLSPEASPRRSPTKKPSLHHLTGPASALPQSAPFRRPSLADSYSQMRRFSGPEPVQNYGHQLPRMQSQQFWSAAQTTPSLQASQSPSWGYPQNTQSVTRSPSTAPISAGSKTSLLPSPAGSSNPQLIRTSTIHQSPTTPGAATPVTHNFNPYAMYPSNSKAQLKIEGDLSTMSQNWTDAEWEAGRRLVQFRRSQSGSVITATFEPVTLEDRIPNSICVSCIYWKEKSECYVTSVDTISLLESLVGVRFTVEEKNRIRRNLEGFRPATVSKTKQDSEDFFKLIMGFPNPKPRNIEKDVKVFPWRILAGALRKIIGKYSASYSSTAGALHAHGAGPGSGYSGGRTSEVGIEQVQTRPIASPLSTSSSATSHGNAFAPSMAATVYSAHTQAMGPAGLGIGASAAGPPDLRLAVPVTATSQATSWHQPSANYTSDLSATGRGSWDFPGSYLTTSPATGMPTSAQAYQYATAQTCPPQARFVPLQGYEAHNHQTSGGQ